MLPPVLCLAVKRRQMLWRPTSCPIAGVSRVLHLLAKSVSTDEGRTATTTQQMPGESRLKASIGEGVARAEGRMSTLCWAEGLFDIDSGKCFTHSSSQLRFFHASSDMPALAGAWALEIQWQGLMGRTSAARSRCGFT